MLRYIFVIIINIIKVLSMVSAMEYILNKYQFSSRIPTPSSAPSLCRGWLWPRRCDILSEGYPSLKVFQLVGSILQSGSLRDVPGWGKWERSFLVEHLKGTAFYTFVCVLCEALRHAFLKEKFSSQGHGVCYVCILFHSLHLTCCCINLGCVGMGDKLLLKSALECLQMPSSLPCRRGRAP